MIPVVWWNHPAEGKNIARGYWDQGTLERYFAGDLWHTGLTFEHYDTVDGLTGAVVVVPARFHADHVADLNADLARLDWCVVILSSDEESLFPTDAITHPNCTVWTSTPHPDRHTGDRVLGHYLPPHAPALIAASEHEKRPMHWWWSGQVNHDRRNELWKQLRRLPGGTAHRTEGFTQGFEHADYYGRMCAARVIPCPSGPATPDSFRLWEALEAGCVPIADGFAPAMSTPGYWDQFGKVPFPVIDRWRHLPAHLASVVSDWPMLSIECSAWWQQHKRSLAKRLTADVRHLSGQPEPTDPNELVTVIIPTSPIPSHPSLDVIEETIRSIREQLPTADIIVTCDGVRPELEHRSTNYTLYLRRLMWACNQWPNVVPVVRRDHGHQGNTTRSALELVDTPLVLFVEHDTPVIGEIPWPNLCDAVLSDEARVIRLHHEASVLDVHRHLMIGEVQDVKGVPLLATRQWSQRPHLASTDLYRHLISTYFGAESRTMIEDVMHGVVDQACTTKTRGWDEWRLWIYHPEGDMKRSTHLDARGEDPKFERDFVFAYDTDDVPPGAPYPTAWRVD